MATFNVGSILGRFGKKQSYQEHLAAEPSKKILFVCTGNIARSASAQYLAQKMSAENSEWKFDSAGIGAVVNAPVAPDIDKELDARGIDYTGHKAKQVTEAMVADAALVLTMEKEHLNWLVREYPRYRNRIHLLKEVSRLRGGAGRRVDPVSYLMQQDQEPQSHDNIADPYRKGPVAAEVAVREIEEALTIVIPWLGN